MLLCGAHSGKCVCCFVKLIQVLMCMLPCGVCAGIFVCVWLCGAHSGTCMCCFVELIQVHVSICCFVEFIQVRVCILLCGVHSGTCVYVVVVSAVIFTSLFTVPAAATVFIL